MDLNILWFGLLGILLTGYAILDGFDLGVGIIHLAARNDTERRLFLNSIGPLWDGNEVWIAISWFSYAGSYLAQHGPASLPQPGLGRPVR
jgi:cytochrome bd-type quinol oxidase subunit 2